MAIILSGSVAAQSIMPSNNNTALHVINHNGARMNDSNNNTYTFFPGIGSGGLNAVKITDNSSNPSTGKVIFTNSQSGAFYTAYTGGKGYADNGILMLAVNGTLPDNFQVNIKANGYQWIPIGGNPSIYTYNSTTLDETFYKSDFIYGLQTWKPFYSANYPLFEKQDMTNTTNTFNIMLIDLYAGMLNNNDLIDKGTIKIQYSFQNLPIGSLGTFNIFAFTNAAGNQPVGVGWTNAVNNINGASTTTSGYNVNGNSPKTPTYIIVSPAKGIKGDNINLIAKLTDNNNQPLIGKTIKFSIDGTNIGNAVTNTIGIATLSYKILQNKGTYTILTEFLQDNTYATSSSTNNLNIDHTPTKIIINPIIGFKGKITNLIAKLTDNNNQPLIDKIVKFRVSGITIGSARITNTSGIATLNYILTQNSGTYIILAEFLQDNTYATSNNTNRLIVDNTSPKASVTPLGGIYNTTKTVIIKMNKTGIIYYTLNGRNPTMNNTKYTKPITITSSKILKYIAVDLAGNKSPIYTQNYTIDKNTPKVITTSPQKNANRVPLLSPIFVTFSEKLLNGINFNKIYIKNLNTCKTVHITKKLEKNILTLKQIRSRLHNDEYYVYIPKGAFKDRAGNLSIEYSYKFKTQ